MPFDADDLAMFADADMPGYAQALVAGVDSVVGRFHADYVDPLGISSNQPVFMADESLLDSAVSGATVVIGGTSYTVAARKPQRTGELLLELQVS
jgi:hypothetical protein